MVPSNLTWAWPSSFFSNISAVMGVDASLRSLMAIFEPTGSFLPGFNSVHQVWFAVGSERSSSTLADPPILEPRSLAGRTLESFKIKTSPFLSSWVKSLKQ